MTPKELGDSAVKLDTLKQLSEAIGSLEQAKEAVSAKQHWTIAQRAAARATIGRKLDAVRTARDAYMLIGEHMADLPVVDAKGVPLTNADRKAKLLKLMQDEALAELVRAADKGAT